MYYVVGAAGFVGGYVLKELERREHQVSGLVTMDISDRSQVMEFSKRVKSDDVVILAAAQPSKKAPPLLHNHRF